VYENFRSQPLLEEFKESAEAAESVLEFREYDSCHPSRKDCRLLT